MTNSISTFRFALLAAALAFSPLTTALHAQKGVRVNVPFAFQSGSELLPAGLYTITELPSHVLYIKGAKNGGTTMSLMASSVDKVDAPSKVVFKRYGDKYFLREVWTSGSLDHAVCFKTRAEIKAQNVSLSAVAAVTSPASNVEISLNATH